MVLATLQVRVVYLLNEVHEQIYAAAAMPTHQSSLHVLAARGAVYSARVSRQNLCQRQQVGAYLLK